MSIDTLKAALPDYAKDLKLNLGNVLSSTSLNAQQLWGTALASALATRNAAVIAAIAAEAAAHLSPEASRAAKAAASIMGMNNIYYRFTHLVSEPDYQKLPARLRMTIIGNPGVEKLDFELWSLAVSAINGCGMCMDSHEKVVAHGGATKEMVQDAVRIAATLHGIAATLEGEAALAGL
jgi:lipoyl-dependent peroxiredoxin subunit D